jgi:hypothetical protein
MDVPCQAALPKDWMAAEIPLNPPLQSPIFAMDVYRAVRWMCTGCVQGGPVHIHRHGGARCGPHRAVQGHGWPRRGAALQPRAPQVKTPLAPQVKTPRAPQVKTPLARPKSKRWSRPKSKRRSRPKSKRRSRPKLAPKDFGREAPRVKISAARLDASAPPRLSDTCCQSCAARCSPPRVRRMHRGRKLEVVETVQPFQVPGIFRSTRLRHLPPCSISVVLACRVPALS